MSVNYITRYQGGKVAIEVSDPNDIYSLSTLYADGSEARIVDNEAGLYRLLNGVWTYIPGSGRPSGFTQVNFQYTQGQLTADKSYADIITAYNMGKLIVFHKDEYGNAIASLSSDGVFSARFVYMDTNTPVGNIDYIKELMVIDVIMSSQACGAMIHALPRIPIPQEKDNGKVLVVSGNEYGLIDLSR